MNVYRSLVRPLLFRLDPEWAHDRAIRLAEWAERSETIRAAIARRYAVQDPRLAVSVGGIAFPNPLGLAAGWDKNGRAIASMHALGFGHVEIGSISAEPSAGNPRPRLWRLPADRALCVHYGLPNEGAEAVSDRLGMRDRVAPLGINVVRTNRGFACPPDTEADILDDYVRSVRALQPHADYLCLNLSCPNTESGREHFQEPVHVVRLLDALAELPIAKPVVLKVSPLGGIPALERLLRAVEGFDFVRGFAFNLAPGLPDGLRASRSDLAALRGAIAGKPAEALANTRLGEMFRLMDRDRYFLIGVGGVFDADDAYEKIRLGASLVQVLTGLVYEGPGLVRALLTGLARRLERDGFASIGEAIGSAHPISSGPSPGVPRETRRHAGP